MIFKVIIQILSLYISLQQILKFQVQKKFTKREARQIQDYAKKSFGNFSKIIVFIFIPFKYELK